MALHKILCASKADQLVVEAKGLYDMWQSRSLDFSRAVELDSDLSEAYTKRSVLYLASGDQERALDDLAKAIELNPADGTATVKSG